MHIDMRRLRIVLEAPQKRHSNFVIFSSAPERLSKVHHRSFKSSSGPPIKSRHTSKVRRSLICRKLNHQQRRKTVLDTRFEQLIRHNFRKLNLDGINHRKSFFSDSNPFFDCFTLLCLAKGRCVALDVSLDDRRYPRLPNKKFSKKF